MHALTRTNNGVSLMLLLLFFSLYVSLTNKKSNICLPACKIHQILQCAQ